METRPRLQITLSRTDKTINIACWLIIAAVWAIPLACYHTLPETIPIHYDAAGNIDRYGSRLTIFALPPIATFVFALLSLVARYPHSLNYPVPITERNAAKQYALAVTTLNMLRLITGFTFLGIVLETIFPAVNGFAGVWLVPLSVMFVFIPVTWFVVKSRQNR